MDKLSSCFGLIDLDCSDYLRTSCTIDHYGILILTVNKFLKIEFLDKLNKQEILTKSKGLLRFLSIVTAIPDLIIYG